MTSCWSGSGMMYLAKTISRPSVVGKWTSSIWIAPSFSSALRNVNPGAWAWVSYSARMTKSALQAKVSPSDARE